MHGRQRASDAEAGPADGMVRGDRRLAPTGPSLTRRHGLRHTALPGRISRASSSAMSANRVFDITACRRIDDAQRQGRLIA